MAQSPTPLVPPSGTSQPQSPPLGYDTLRIPGYGDLRFPPGTPPEQIRRAYQQITGTQQPGADAVGKPHEGILSSGPMGGLILGGIGELHNLATFIGGSPQKDEGGRALPQYSPFTGRRRDRVSTRTTTEQEVVPAISRPGFAYPHPRVGEEASGWAPSFWDRAGLSKPSTDVPFYENEAGLFGFGSPVAALIEQINAADSPWRRSDLARGFANVALTPGLMFESLTSPQSAAVIGGAMAISATFPAAAWLVSLGFTLDLALGVLATSPDVWKLYKDGNYPEAAGAAAQVAGIGFMGYHAGRHATAGAGRYFSPGKLPNIASQVTKLRNEGYTDKQIARRVGTRTKRIEEIESLSFRELAEAERIQKAAAGKEDGVTDELTILGRNIRRKSEILRKGDAPRKAPPIRRHAAVRQQQRATALAEKGLEKAKADKDAQVKAAEAGVKRAEAIKIRARSPKGKDAALKKKNNAIAAAQRKLAEAQAIDPMRNPWADFLRSVNPEVLKQLAEREGGVSDQMWTNLQKGLALTADVQRIPGPRKRQPSAGRPEPRGDWKLGVVRPKDVHAERTRHRNVLKAAGMRDSEIALAEREGISLEMLARRVTEVAEREAEAARRTRDELVEEGRAETTGEAQTGDRELTSYGPGWSPASKSKSTENATKVAEKQVKKAEEKVEKIEENRTPEDRELISYRTKTKGEEEQWGQGELRTVPPEKAVGPSAPPVEADLPSHRLAAAETKGATAKQVKAAEARLKDMLARIEADFREGVIDKEDYNLRIKRARVSVQGSWSKGKKAPWRGAEAAQKVKETTTEAQRKLAEELKEAEQTRWKQTADKLEQQIEKGTEDTRLARIEALGKRARELQKAAEARGKKWAAAMTAAEKSTKGTKAQRNTAWKNADRNRKRAKADWVNATNDAKWLEWKYREELKSPTPLPVPKAVKQPSKPKPEADLTAKGEQFQEVDPYFDANKTPKQIAAARKKGEARQAKAVKDAAIKRRTRAVEKVEEEVQKDKAKLEELELEAGVEPTAKQERILAEKLEELTDKEEHLSHLKSLVEAEKESFKTRGMSLEDAAKAAEREKVVAVEEEPPTTAAGDARAKEDFERGAAADALLEETGLGEPNPVDLLTGKSKQPNITESKISPDVQSLLSLAVKSPVIREILYKIGDPQASKSVRTQGRNQLKAALPTKIHWRNVDKAAARLIEMRDEFAKAADDMKPALLKKWRDLKFYDPNVMGMGREAHLAVDLIADAIRYGTNRAASGVSGFSKWSMDMVKVFGNEIRPHLPLIWEKAKEQIQRDIPVAVQSGSSEVHMRIGEATAGRDRLTQAQEGLKNLDIPPHLEPAIIESALKSDIWADKLARDKDTSWTGAAARGKLILEDTIKKWKPGKGATDTFSLRSGELVAGAAYRYSKALEKIEALPKGDVRHGLIAEMKEAEASFELLLAVHAGHASEAGRALNAQRAWKAMVTEGRVDGHYDSAIKALAKMGKTPEQLITLAKEAAKIKDPFELYRFVKDQHNPKLSNYLNTYVMTNYLGNVATHQRNVIGTAFNLFLNMPTQALAVPLDIAAAAIKGRGIPGEMAQHRKIYLGDIGAQFTGIWGGAQAGWYKAGQIIKNGYNIDNVSAFDVPRVEILAGTKAELPANFIGRALDAADTFFRSMDFEMERHGLSYAEAKRREARGQGTFIEEYTKILADTFKEAPEILKIAEQRSLRSVFREDPGWAVNKLISWKRKLADETRKAEMSPYKLALGTANLATDIFIPFIRTPANLTRQGLEMTPLGLLGKRAYQSTREARQYQGRMILGSLTLIPLVQMAVNGQLTGSMDSYSDEEKAALFDMNVRPNSILMKLPDWVASNIAGAHPTDDGKYWVDYSNFPPVSTVMSFLGNSVEGYKNQRKKEVPFSWDRKISSFVRAQWGTANSILDQSYLQGIFQFTEALQDPDQFWHHFAAQGVRGLLPLSSQVGAIGRAVDPIIRDTTTFSARLKASYPILPTLNPFPRTSVYGNVMERPTNLVKWGEDIPVWHGELSAIKLTPAKDDWVTQELLAINKPLGYTNPTPPYAAPGAESRAVQNAERFFQNMVKGKMRRRIVEEVMRTESYRNHQRVGDTADSIQIRRAMIEAGLTQATPEFSRLFSSLPQVGGVPPGQNSGLNQEGEQRWLSMYDEALSKLVEERFLTTKGIVQLDKEMTREIDDLFNPRTARRTRLETVMWFMETAKQAAAQANDQWTTSAQYGKFGRQ